MNNSSLWRSSYLALSLILLGACSSGTVPLSSDQPPLLTNPTQYSAEDYLKIAKENQTTLSIDWQLLAAKAYIEDGQLDQGFSLLNQVTPATDRQKAGWQLLAAYGYQLRGLPAKALAQLNFDSWELPNSYWRQYYNRRATLEGQLNRPIAEATDRISLDRYLDDDERRANQRAIWQQLKPLDSYTLRSFQQPGKETLNGYLELAAISNEPVTRAEELLNKLNQWQLAYPNHPAAQFIKGKLSDALQAPLYTPKKIAILLPLSGHFAQSGQMLRDGILAAYSDLAKDGREMPQLNFIDTIAQPMSEIAKQLDAQQSEFVVGPLLKSNIEAFAKLQQQRPWLALNNIHDGRNDEETDEDEKIATSHQYTLSLEPETEAQQAAQEMSQRGEHHPLLLLPDNALGKRMANSFADQWQANHQDTPEVTYYSDRSHLQTAVRQMLKTDESQQRIRQVKALLGQDLKSEVRSRRDADAVYIVADNVTTKLLIPFINVTISPFAEPMQIFGSSRTQQEGVNNQELNGMIISEIPWLLDRTSDNALRFRSFWPQASDMDKRLYALGYDAYHILPTLAQMRGFSDYHIQGLTGLLSVANDGQVERSLNWSEYRNGQLETIFEQNTP